MSKRTIKTLNNTGRISRSKVRTAVIEIRNEISHKSKTPSLIAKVNKRTTASGRSAIAFNISEPCKSNNKRTTDM